MEGFWQATEFPRKDFNRLIIDTFEVSFLLKLQICKLASTYGHLRSCAPGRNNYLFSKTVAMMTTMCSTSRTLSKRFGDILLTVPFVKSQLGNI